MSLEERESITLSILKTNESAYIDYSMSVIVSNYLIRDGLNLSTGECFWNV